MQNNTNILLASAELSGLWNSYMGNTLSVCVLKYFVNRVDDNDTRFILFN